MFHNVFLQRFKYVLKCTCIFWIIAIHKRRKAEVPSSRPTRVFLYIFFTIIICVRRLQVNTTRRLSIDRYIADINKYIVTFSFRLHTCVSNKYYLNKYLEWFFGHKNNIYIKYYLLIVHTHFHYNLVRLKAFFTSNCHSQWSYSKD